MSTPPGGAEVEAEVPRGIELLLMPGKSRLLLLLPDLLKEMKLEIRCRPTSQAIKEVSDL